MENKEPEKRSYGILKGFILGVLATLAVLSLYYAVSITAFPAVDPSSPASVEKIRQIEETVDQHYLGEIDKEQMTDFMYYGLVAGLGDRYSMYFNEKEYEEVTNVQSGEFKGIGIGIGQDAETGRLVVTEVYEDAPADRAGMEPGDVLLSVDGVDVTGYTPTDAVSLIQENETGPIAISVLRGEEMLSFSLVPETILRDPVESEILEDDIGYIRIGTFDQLTAEQFGKALDSMKEAEVKGLIIDLRGNLGGLVSASCDTLREFLPEGILVYTVDKEGNRKDYLCDGEHPLDLPMALLVNGNTASSAEIFAGAVKDYGMATLVGTRTFGKGIMQNAFELSDGSMVRLTVAHYYTPNGNDIHGKGIEPDIVIEEEEEQLAKAVEILKQS